MNVFIALKGTHFLFLWDFQKTWEDLDTILKKKTKKKQKTNTNNKKQKKKKKKERLPL